MTNSSQKKNFILNIIKSGTCTGCGLCVGIDLTGKSKMIDTSKGPVPQIHENAMIPEYIFDSCPGSKLDYPQLYLKHYGKYPDNWLCGIIHSVYTGYSRDDNIRRNGASGGIITNILIYLLETKKIDAAIVVQQGIPVPEKARVIIARNTEAILNASQSVYIPVSILDILNLLNEKENYAITGLPDQTAALRILQQENHPQAIRIKYVLGLYTGTALYPEVISAYLKMNRIKKNDKIISLKWRAGEWPGYLEITTESGRILKSPKVYYNFMIPFYVTNTSLQNIDFCNEFADIAVGDAWSPVFEKDGKGFSLIVARKKEINEILMEMEHKGLIALNKENLETATSMHGHMIDFKKRGGYIRNRLRRFFGKNAPYFGYIPANIKISRVLVEFIISGIFLVCRTKIFREILILVPEKILGPVFNHLRLGWKNISKPVKRKGLNEFKVIIT